VVAISLGNWVINRIVLVFALVYLAQGIFASHLYFALSVASIAAVILVRTIWALFVGTQRRRIIIPESDAGKDASQVNFVIPGYFLGVMYWPKILHGPRGNIVKSGQIVEVIW